MRHMDWDAARAVLAIHVRMSKRQHKRRLLAILGLAVAVAVVSEIMALES